MEQHQIPQQISTYQFRLVGDMTLKQFFQVGGGSLIAIILYSTNFPFYVKWPLILISFLFGVALAFFPIEDRPLSKWILLFAKSIYAPTLYIWAKNYQKPQYFQPEGVATLPLPHEPIPQVPLGETNAQEGTTGSDPALDQKEAQFLSNVATHLESTAPISEKPVVGIETMIVPDFSTTPKREIAPTPPVAESREVTLPQLDSIAIEKSEKIFEEPVAESVPIADQGGEQYQVSAIPGAQTANTSAAQFSSDTSAPSTPTRGNIIVGQVMDKEGKIAENVILEIRDEEGRPVRALKSNKLGHFMIVTPLTNGKYTIISEKDGFEFEPITIIATGEIIMPIAIRAKAL